MTSTLNNSLILAAQSESLSSFLPQITRDTCAHGTNHPAHVAHEEESVFLLKISTDMHVARYHGPQETDVCPDTSFRFAGSTRRVQNQCGLVSLHLDCL